MKMQYCKAGRNFYISCAAITTITLSGCASGPPISAYYAPSKAISIPAINVQSTADIGQTIIAKANVTRIPAIKLPTPVAENINFTSVTRIQPGPLPLSATSDAGKYYRDVTTQYGGIFVPNDSSNPAVIYLAPQAGNYGKIPVNGIENTEIEQWGKDSFKRELIYSGLSQNTISISYREFIDNIARPAFSQELKYDLSQGTTIGYKGARFEVVKATNTELVYRVLKPLD
ncbi:MAG: hypothetical protein Q8N48_06930 [Thiobacillus sp.]|nr:hypothetical protein [Thiobacillus sp.]MDP2978546.1 hypothetical protein [Thiobacillus sp.]